MEYFKAGYKEKINPCYECGCDCYDPDMGCEMPSIDRWYACQLKNDGYIDDGYIDAIEKEGGHDGN